jgi:hypothetical protein
VAILCEAPLSSPAPEASLTNRSYSWVSAGTLAHKGVAIASASPLWELDLRPRLGRWSVAAQPEIGPAVLGIWSCPDRLGGDAYADEVVATLDAWGDVLATLDAWGDVLVRGEMMVAGDFNVGFAVGRSTVHPRLAKVQAAWEALGLVSAYHAFTGEDFSVPSQATYFHRDNRDQGWHIDYVLVPRAWLGGLRQVAVGVYDDWIGKGRSDHTPIVVDVDW